MQRYAEIAKGLCVAVLLFIVSSVYSFYLQLEPVPFWRLALFCSLLGCCHILHAKGGDTRAMLGTRGIVGFCIFSSLFSASLLIGKHVHVEASYSGHMDVNYLTPFGMADLAAFVPLFLGTLILCAGAYALLESGLPARLISHPRKQRDPSSTKGRFSLPIQKKRVAVYALVMAIAWLHYLLSFWPGYIFSDTVSSLKMSVGHLNNHHPVAYTLFLKAGIAFGRKVGLGATTGLALTTMVQMVFMGWSLGHLAEWLRERLCVRTWLSYAMVAIFALTPYVANFSNCALEGPDLYLQPRMHHAYDNGPRAKWRQDRKKHQMACHIHTAARRMRF